jgi:hypothetical protein
MNCKILRIRAIVIGFGVALLLASSARAQETENTNWQDSPAPTNATATSNDINSEAAKPAAAKPGVVQQSDLSKSSPAPQWVTVPLLVCMALVALYTLAKTRRRNRNINTRTGQINRRPSF